MSVRSENGREQNESAVSGTIWAALALTIREKRDSLSGRRKRSEAM
jgi:hypothetical protein